MGVLAFAVGFYLQAVLVPRAPIALKPEPEPDQEAVSARFREISSIGQPGLELFFAATGRPGIVYFYRTDCRECDAQWASLRPLVRSMPMLVASFDDSRASLAQKLASEPGSLPFIPHHVPPRRMLTVRTWLRDHNCPFSGHLPFVAVTDGNGNCAAAWEGETPASTIVSAYNYMKDNNSPAAASLLVR